MSSFGHRSRGEQGVRLRRQRLQGLIEGGIPVQSVSEGCYDETRIQRANLVGYCELSSFRDAILEAPRASEGARVLDCNLEGVQIQDGALQSLRLEESQLGEAQIQKTRFGALVRCDLRRARLEDCSFAQLDACQLDGSTLIRCELGDVSNSSFHGARLLDCKITAAAGADFTGARGLTPELRQKLTTLGATCRRRPPRSLLAAGAVLVLVGGWLATAPPSETATGSRGFVPTQDQRVTSQQALSSLRERLAHAHHTMKETGAINRVWPTVRDLKQNRYDMDGDGPLESWDLIATSGLPQNLLTPTDGGVVPFCKEEPTQTDLTGLDTDWYYCELNGRLLAAAGGSGEATLNW